MFFFFLPHTLEETVIVAKTKAREESIHNDARPEGPGACKMSNPEPLGGSPIWEDL